MLSLAWLGEQFVAELTLTQTCCVADHAELFNCVSSEEAPNLQLWILMRQCNLTYLDKIFAIVSGEVLEKTCPVCHCGLGCFEGMWT